MGWRLNRMVPFCFVHRVVLTTFYYYVLDKSLIWVTKNTFSILSYIFLIHQSVLCHLIWGIWQYHRSKDFETMKTEKLAIQPWLSCQYAENMLMDEPWFCGQIRKKILHLFWNFTSEKIFSPFHWMLFMPFPPLLLHW